MLGRKRAAPRTQATSVGDDPKRDLIVIKLQAHVARRARLPANVTDVILAEIRKEEVASRAERLAMLSENDRITVQRLKRSSRSAIRRQEDRRSAGTFRVTELRKLGLARLVGNPNDVATATGRPKPSVHLDDVLENNGLCGLSDFYANRQDTSGVNQAGRFASRARAVDELVVLFPGDSLGHLLRQPLAHRDGRPVQHLVGNVTETRQLVDVQLYVAEARLA